MGYVRKEVSAFTVDLLLFLAFQIGNKQLMFQALLLSQPGLLSPYTTYQVINKKGSQSSYQETEPGCFIPERWITIEVAFPLEPSGIILLTSKRYSPGGKLA